MSEVVRAAGVCKMHIMHFYMLVTKSLACKKRTT